MLHDDSVAEEIPCIHEHWEWGVIPVLSFCSANVFIPLFPGGELANPRPDSAGMFAGIVLLLSQSERDSCRDLVSTEYS